MRHSRPIRVGLTGSLASGKSTVLKVFHKHGWAVISADDVVAEIYQRMGLSKETLAKRFGKTKTGLKELEKWIHPLVKKDILRFIKSHRQKPVIVEVPLLFEAQFDKLFDASVFIYAPTLARETRALNRGMSRELFRFLDSKQFSAREKALRADFVLHNWIKPRLKAQAKTLSKILLKA